MKFVVESVASAGWLAGSSNLLNLFFVGLRSLLSVFDQLAVRAGKDEKQQGLLTVRWNGEGVQSSGNDFGKAGVFLEGSLKHIVLQPPIRLDRFQPNANYAAAIKEVVFSLSDMAYLGMELMVGMLLCNLDGSLVEIRIS